MIEACVSVASHRAGLTTLGKVERTDGHTTMLGDNRESKQRVM